jgi:hypothetical protein
MSFLPGAINVPGWHFLEGIYRLQGTDWTDIVFDSVSIWFVGDHGGRIEFKVRLVYGIVAFDRRGGSNWSVHQGPGDNETYFRVKLPGNNELRFVFVMDEVLGPVGLRVVQFKLVDPSLKHSLYFNFETSFMRYEFLREPLHWIEGLYVDKNVDPAQPPSQWADGTLHPMVVSLGHVYYPRIWDWYTEDFGRRVDTIKRQTNFIHVTEWMDEFDWVFPELNKDLDPQGMIVRNENGDTLGWYQRVAPLRFNTGVTSFPTGPKFIGTWESFDRQQLKITENVMITVDMYDPKVETPFSFVLIGQHDFYYGYMTSPHAVMIYYPYLLVHWNAFVCNSKMERLESSKQLYLPQGYSWRNQPNVKPKPETTYVNITKSNPPKTLVGLVGLLLVAFMVK